MSTTLFLLAAQFGSKAAVEITAVAGYFGLSESVAQRKASERQLPVPCFKMGDSAKAPWLVRLDDLAAHIDTQRDAAKQTQQAVNSL